MTPFVKRHGVNVAMMATALGLGLWVAVIEPALQSTNESELRAKNLFRVFSRTGLTGIELAPAGGASVVLSRANIDAPWWLSVDGADVEGEEGAIDKLAAAIEYATTLRETSGGVFGLEAPRLHGAIVVNGKRQEFSIGSEAPAVAGAAGTAYVRVGTEPVHVVGAAFVAELLAPTSRLYDRRVVPYLSVETKRVELLKGGRSVVAFERTDDRLWHFAEGRERVSRVASDGFWAAIADLQSEKELGVSAWPSDRDSEVLTVRLVPRDGRPAAGLEMLAGCKDTPGATLRVSGAKSRVVCVGAGAFERLSKLTREAFRDTAPIALRPDEIQSIRITESGETFELGRAGAGFVVRSQRNEPVPSELNADVVAWLQELGRSGHRLDEGPSASSHGVLEVYTEKSEPSESVAIVRREGERLILQRKSDGIFVEVSGAVAARISSKGAWLRSRKVFAEALAAKAVRRLELACDGRHEVVERAAEGWAFVEPKGAPADGARVLDVASKLLSLRADRWLEGEEISLQNTCRAAVTLEGAEAAVEVRLGDSREGATLATATGARGAFLAPKATRELLTGSLVDRVLGPGDLDAAFTITVTRGKASAVFTRTGSGFRLRGAEENVAVVERFTSRLSSLIADDVLHTGEAVTADGVSAPTSTIAWARADGTVMGSLRFGRTSMRDGQKLVAVLGPRGGAVLAVREDVVRALLEPID